MAAWSYRISDAPAALEFAPEIGTDVKCALPHTDYYIHADRGIGTDEDAYDLANDGPIARGMVESAYKVYVERNLYAHLTSVYKERRDYYHDEGAELSVLASQPPTFVLFGKPGVGTTTLAKKIVEYLKCVYLSPNSVTEYYRHNTVPEAITPGGVTLGEEEKPPDSTLLKLFQARMQELDVLHRGYVLEGIPRFNAESDASYEEQVEALTNFDPKPEYIIVPHMQDVDLFKRRSEQKVDTQEGEKYTRSQYTNKKVEPMEHLDPVVYYSKQKRKHSLDIVTDAEYAGLTSMVYSQSRPDLAAMKTVENGYFDEDTVPVTGIPSDVILRLVTSEDDSPYNVQRSFERYRDWLPYLQTFIDKCDVRKVLELNAYWAPQIIMKMVLEFIDNYGLTPAPLPIALVSEVPLPKMAHEDLGEADSIFGEGEGTESEEEDDAEGTEPRPCSPPPPPDWPAILRACTLRGRVDPKFRWRLSRWKNLCPVALKHGRSIAGKPEFATGFLDKIYFLSCKEALEQFEFNPRPFLLPTMPRSPIKFFVAGHPSAGKTVFCKKLARHVGGFVVNMDREFEKRWDMVKFDYLFRVRVQTTTQAMKNIDHENYEDWKRQERHRRNEIMEWIEKFINRKADAELNSLLKMEKEEREARRMELYKSTLDHKLADQVVGGQCTSEQGDLGFSWKDFVAAVIEGRRHFGHQQKLELAWKLFREGRLRYKGRRRGVKKLLQRLSGTSQGLESGDFGEEELGEYDEYAGEEGESSVGKGRHKKRRKHKRKKSCIPPPAEAPDEEEVAPFLEVIEPKESSVFGLEEESDESIKMRFPEIPAELIDSIQRPANVGEKDELVLEYVEGKLAEAEEWAKQVPPVLYVELLRRVLRDIEAKYQKRTMTGALTGGWIIDNLPHDFEKWRAILRTPDTAPDNVVALIDYTADYSAIYKRLKSRFARLEQRRLKGLEDEVSASEDETEELGGETTELATTPSKKLSAAERLMSILPVEELTRKYSYEFVQGQLLQLKRDLGRQEAADELGLDIAADYKHLLQAWFKTFKSNFANRKRSGSMDASGSVASVGRGKSTRSVAHRDDSSREDTPFTPFDEMDVAREHMKKSGLQAEWTGRVINFEMLAHLESPELADMLLSLDDQDGSNTKMRTMIKDGVHTSNVKMDALQRYKNMTLDELKGEGIDIDSLPLEYLEQFGEDGRLPPLMLKEAHSSDDHWSSGRPTPTGLLSQPDILCNLPPEDHGGEGYARPNIPRLYTEEVKGEEGAFSLPPAPTLRPASPCVPKIHEPSVKHQFLEKINKFNEFWVKAVPLLNKHEVHFWESGILNEDNALEKINMIWDELESRFVLTPQEITEGDLHDDEESWKAADAKWHAEELREKKRREDAMKPFSPNLYPETQGEDDYETIRDQIAGVNSEEEEETGSNILSDDDDESYEFDSAEGESDAESGNYLSEKEGEKLARLAKKPEDYLKYLNAQQGKRFFGDVKDYCPVTLHELGLIRKGSPKHAAKYRDRLYLFVDEACVEKFVANPSKYLPKNAPPNVPPPRICLTGAPACGQEELGLEMSREHGIYYFNFRQKLHEIVRVKYGKDAGPDSFPKDLDTSQGSDGSLLGLKESMSEFDIPSKLLLDDKAASGTNEDERSAELPPPPDTDQEYDGEGGEPQAATDALGADHTAQIFECPINSLERTEKIAGRDWNENPNLVESSVKAFLDNGDQLPDEVLYELLSPFWEEEPFKSKGFIMTGFPNTWEDVEFMVKHNFVPEFVYTLECKPKTMRNRMITKTVDNWHFHHPSSMKMKTLDDDEPLVPPMDRAFSKVKSGTLFNYHTVEKTVRAEVLAVEAPRRASWTYNDSITTTLSDSLYQYHELYTKGLRHLQMSLNSHHINWKPIHTDFSLQMSKEELRKCLTSTLKYRNSFFESTYVLYQHEALVLLERGFFQLSKFGRWCPVQISKGNTAVNLWNGPGTKKTPVLHRHYIYYIAGEENVDYFRENVWNIVTQALPTPSMPLFVVVTGPPKSGKSLLAQKLAYKLGLVYISEETMMDEIVKHSFLNKITEQYDLSSSRLTSGPQSMLMADEILAYLRAGYAVPAYMICRVMDLALMAPRAQFHGAVFDGYPLEVSQLQELLERGVVPSVVVNLQMELDEAFDRCERHRFDPAFNYETLLEESNPLVEHLYEESQVRNAPLLNWFRNETQCVFNVHAKEHPTAIYEKVTEHCFDVMKKHQKYIRNHQLEKPTTLDGTTPLTSVLHTKFTREFGAYDPVAINESYELMRVDDYTDLTRVVEYRDEIYVFSNQEHVDMFMKNPAKYTVPTCEYVPPEIVPSPFVLTPAEMEQLAKNWGFKDFDPVHYYEGNFEYKWLQRGKSEFCAEYNKKLYFFINQANLNKFLKKPYLYTDVPFPTKFPSHPTENPLDTVSPAGYIIGTGLSQELTRMLTLLALKRPRFPFMSTTKSGLLYLGYYLKTLDMEAPQELRTHYRRAMAHMTNTQEAAEELCAELNKFHGKRTLPPETKQKLKLFMKLADESDEQKVVDPYIHGLPLSYKSATVGPKSVEVPVADLDLLRDTVTAATVNEIEEEGEGEAHEHGKLSGPPEVMRKPSNSSLMADYVPPPYLAKDKLW